MPSLASGHRRRCDLTIDIRRLYRSCHCAGPSYMSRRASCAHGARCPSWASGRRRCCALAVHIGRLYRSSYRAGRSVKSRRARCALMVFDALFGVGPPPSLCSRRPHWTFLLLSPSCGAIVQVETSSLRSRFSKPFFGARPPPLLCSRRPHRTFTIPLSPSCRAGLFKSRRARCALMVLYALLWRRTTAVAELSPSP